MDSRQILHIGGLHEMIPDFIFEETLDNGYGKFSLWDSFRAWTGLDMCGLVYRDGQWIYKQFIPVVGRWTGEW